MAIRLPLSRYLFQPFLFTKPTFFFSRTMSHIATSPESMSAPRPGAAAGTGLTLTTENADEFWNAAWSQNFTRWREGEMNRPFTRGLYVLLHALGVPEAKAGVDSLPFVITREMDKPELLNGPAEQAAVQEFIKGKTILVPLCGDTPVLAYFLDMGAATVIGADLSAKALSDQRSNNFPGAEFTSTELDAAGQKITLFEAKLFNGGRVLLYQGDFLQLPKCAVFTNTKVDFVYDRASFMAMNPALREDYVHTIAAVIKEDTHVMIERPVREEDDKRGPPFTFPPELPKQLYEKLTTKKYDYQVVVRDVERAVADGPYYFEFISVSPKSL